MVEKLGRARSLRVTQTVQFHPDGNQGDPLELEETLWFAFPEMFRAEIQTESTQRIHVYAREEVLTVVDGRIDTDTETRFDLYKDILLFRSRPLLMHRLEHFGVDASVSSLGRFEDRVAFVVGANYPDESVPQVWIEKGTFLPLRWIVTRATGESRKDSLEVRYHQWHKASDTHYPKLIEFYQGTNLVRSIRLNEIRVNPSFPDSYFDVEHLRSINQPVTPMEPGQVELEEMSEIQRSLEDFGKILE